MKAQEPAKTANNGLHQHTVPSPSQDTPRTIDEHFRQKYKMSFEEYAGYEQHTAPSTRTQTTESYQELIKQGRFAEAEPAAIAEKETIGETKGLQSPEYAHASIELARCYENMGRWAQAKDEYISAREIYLLRGDHRAYATISHRLAIVYTKQGETGEAQQARQDADKEQGKFAADNSQEYATFLHSAAKSKEGQYDSNKDEILKDYKRAKEIYTPNTEQYARLCQDLALFLIHKKQEGEALPILEEAHKIYKNLFGTKHPYYARISNLIASIYKQQGKAEEAEALYMESNDTYLQHVNKNFPHLSQKEKEQFIQPLNKEFEKFHAFVGSRAQANPDLAATTYDNALNLKGRILYETRDFRQRVAQSQDPKVKQLYEDWTKQKEANIQNPTPEGEKKANDMEKALMALTPANKTTPPTWQQVQKNLKKGEAAIEMIHYREYMGDMAHNKPITDQHYIAIILTPYSNKPIIMTEAFKPVHIEGIKSKYLKANGLQGVKEYDYDRLAFEEVWLPLKQYLPNDTKHLYLANDNEMNYINIEPLLRKSLQDKGENEQKGGHRVLDETDINTVTNTKELINRRQATYPKKGDKAALFGNKQFDGNPDIAPLPNTSTEINKVEEKAKKAGLQVDKQINVGEAAIKAVKNPYLLHIATHGEGSDKPASLELDAQSRKSSMEETALLMSIADGSGNSTEYILNALEIESMSLQGTELVVFSACQTATGETHSIEGVYGLIRAARIAGAKTVIAPLVNVLDDTTPRFMETFYDFWLNKKLSKREAFNNAKRKMNKEYPDLSRSWNAFIMIGEE